MSKTNVIQELNTFPLFRERVFLRLRIKVTSLEEKLSEADLINLTDLATTLFDIYLTQLERELNATDSSLAWAPNSVVEAPPVGVVKRLKTSSSELPALQAKRIPH